jgi:hypothetical protein
MEEQLEMPPAPEVGAAMEADAALAHEIQELAATEETIEHADEPTADELPVVVTASPPNQDPEPGVEL